MKRKGAKSTKRKTAKPAPKKRKKVKAAPRKKKGAKPRGKKQAKSSPKRDYKAEYRARLKRALDRGYSRDVARGHAKPGKAGIALAKKYGLEPGEDLKRLIELDRARVFGGLDRAPTLEVGDGGVPGFALRVKELAQRPGFFAWEDEAEIIEQFMALGMTEREAYTTWVSP